jgi:hypothetical protein
MSLFLKNTIAFLIVLIIPLVLLSMLYIYIDPFKIVKKYDVFYDKQSKGSISMNRDYVSTTNFLNLYESEQYNSFIFGNSRSIFYQISDWKKHIDSNSNCYHYDASGESIYAINKKIEFLSMKGISLKNILIILDVSTLVKDKPQQEHLNITAPALVDNSNFMEFHYAFYKVFLTPKFLYAIVDYTINDSVKPYMIEKQLITKNHIDYTKELNEIQYNYIENLIKTNSYYTPIKKKEFYKRTNSVINSKPVIFESQNAILDNIAKILKSQHSNYKIVISPLYDQKRISRQDLTKLEHIFGNQKVFDFSGKNKFTNDYRNYYETSHYRPHVAREILEEVYNDKR